MENNSINIHKELIEGCKKGDRKAQYEIFKLYKNAMFNTAYRMTGDSDDAEDILQESFITCFSKIEQYRGEASFGSWLKRIVINNSLNFLRKDRGVEELKENQYDDYYYEWEEVPDHNLEIEQVRTAISELPVGFRTVITLYLFEGYDHAEIGQILQISESTSKSQYNRAKKKLREILNTEYRYG